METEFINLEDRARTAIGLGESHFREFKTALHGTPGQKQLAPKTPNKPESSSAPGNRQLAAARTSALPGGQSIPATNWKQPVNTSDMAEPVSVTENTTKFLTDETEGR
jgi:hypothetical protein